MTETNALVGTRLWTPQGFRDDDWSHAESADALSSNGRFILPLRAFLDIGDDIRKSAGERIGVLLLPGDALDQIVDRLDGLALVALAFPSFSDGRSFSKAELLRSRHQFAGVVRATGQVLIDQLPHMMRVGFDEFEVSHRTLIERLEAGDIGGLPLYYQPAAKPAEPTRTYSWRRVPAR